MTIVLHASLTLSWYFEDERTPAADALLDRVTEIGATVPTLPRLEVAQGPQVAIRRKRCDVAFRDRALAELHACRFRWTWRPMGSPGPRHCNWPLVSGSAFATHATLSWRSGRMFRLARAMCCSARRRWRWAFRRWVRRCSLAGEIRAFADSLRRLLVAVEPPLREPISGMRHRERATPPRSPVAERCRPANHDTFVAPTTHTTSNRFSLIATHSSLPATQSAICRSDVPLRMAGSSLVKPGYDGMGV